MGKNNALFKAAKAGDLAAVQKWLAQGAARCALARVTASSSVSDSSVVKLPLTRYGAACNVARPGADVNYRGDEVCIARVPPSLMDRN
jgi:hypothetical protein